MVILMQMTSIPNSLPPPFGRRYRNDGWTPERQWRFIAALADTGSPTLASQAVRMSLQGAYALRRHPEGDAFRRAWDLAVRSAMRRVAEVTLERALHGTPVPVFHQGEQVGERRVWNDKLLMHMLARADAERCHDDAVPPPPRAPAAKKNAAPPQRQLTRHEHDLWSLYDAVPELQMLSDENDTLWCTSDGDHNGGDAEQADQRAPVTGPSAAAEPPRSTEFCLNFH